MREGRQEKRTQRARRGEGKERGEEPRGEGGKARHQIEERRDGEAGRMVGQFGLPPFENEESLMGLGLASSWLPVRSADWPRPEGDQ